MRRRHISHIRIRIEPAVQANWIALQVPTSRRIVSAVVVVLRPMKLHKDTLL